MRIAITILLLFSNLLVFSQEQKKEERKSLIKTAEQKAKEKAQKSPITSYKIFSIEKDTIFVDTTLSIKQEYKYNYQRKDIFGLMPFSNEGQTYTTLDFGLTKFTYYPDFGYKAKAFNYLKADEIKYYSVATPLTELYFKTVMEQGQNVDALITLNTSQQFNFSLAFKGLRSLGKYINQLSSNGNFRFTSSYAAKDKRYIANFHFTGQDLSNGENGGITVNEDFEGENTTFKNRARLQVYFKDAKTILKGKRFFIDHILRINSKDASNNLFIANQLIYEHKFFDYFQPTIASTITSTSAAFNRFGKSIVGSNAMNHTYYNMFYNKIGAIYENKTLGRFYFFIENRYNNYYFDEEKVVENIAYPMQIKATLNSFGGQYEYRKNKWNGIFIYSNSISKDAFRNLDANLNYKLDDKNSISFQFQNISKLPDNNYNLHQSTYVKYNWINDFNNEKINNIAVKANTKWANAALQLTTLDDHLYFSNDTIGNEEQYITPKQYIKTINYLSLRASKEFKFRKWALDNTVLYQKVTQNDHILNLPEFTTRNTLYYSDHLFKRAMFLQTGITLNYFSKYYADDYNPLLGEFFVQNDKKIGDFPMLDFFVNAQIRQARVFLKAEHFNSSFTGNDFYSSPSTPYHDFMIRFGIVWNFFQ